MQQPLPSPNRVALATKTSTATEVSLCTSDASCYLYDFELRKSLMAGDMSAINSVGWNPHYNHVEQIVKTLKALLA